MKSCDYCGRENEETLTRCAECGTELSREDFAEPSVSGAPRILDFKIATIIVVVSLVAQGVAALLTVIIAEAFQPANHRYAFGGITEELRATTPACVLMATLAGGAAMWITTVKFRLNVTETGPTGAAWVLGSKDAIIKGVGIGMLIAFASHFILHFFGRDHSFPRMEFTFGAPQIIYMIAGVFLAPPIEEMLFRGLLFGGFCQSFGLDRAAIGTTAIFVLLHVFQLIDQPLAVFGITAAAIAALWMRVRHRAIGAAIAVHFGYNFLALLGNLMRH